MRTNQNIRKINIDEGDDYITGCLSTFQEKIRINSYRLSKQQALNVDPKAIQ